LLVAPVRTLRVLNIVVVVDIVVVVVVLLSIFVLFNVSVFVRLWISSLSLLSRSWVRQWLRQNRTPQQKYQ